jgi:hypothetical protein
MPADDVRFQGMRYIDPTLAAYVGESVVLRYDPRDLAEVRLFHPGKFLCRAICPQLAGATVPLRDIKRARERPGFCQAVTCFGRRGAKLLSITTARSRLPRFQRFSRRRRSSHDALPDDAER